MNSRDAARLRTLLADVFAWESAGTAACGPEQAVRAWHAWFTYVPDLRLDPMQARSRGDWSIQQLRLRGTHRSRETGAFTSHPNRANTIEARFDLPGCAVHAVRGGHITRLWTYWDETALRRSGATPPHADY